MTKVDPKIIQAMPTLNNMGYMPEWLDVTQEEFLSFLKLNPEWPGLDIGAAYGFVCKKAIEQGTSVIANDLDPRHLDQLRLEIRSDLCSFVAGRFPYEVDFASESLGAILLSRILHFLHGNEIEDGFKRLYKWLVPGGKVFVEAMTPFIKAFEPHLKSYQDKKKTQKWPGEIEVPQDMMNFYQNQIPTEMNLLDRETLEVQLKAKGFVIERAFYFTPKNAPQSICLDGREAVAIVAMKPTR